MNRDDWHDALDEFADYCIVPICIALLSFIAGILFEAAFPPPGLCH